MPISTSHVSNHFHFQRLVSKPYLYPSHQIPNQFVYQITIIGLCYGPPSSRPLASSARVCRHWVLYSRVYPPSPSFVPSAARSVFPPCALPKAPPKDLPPRPLTPDLQAIRTKGLRTLLKRLRVLLPSVMTSQAWNCRTGNNWRRLGVASGMSST